MVSVASWMLIFAVSVGPDSIKVEMLERERFFMSSFSLMVMVSGVSFEFTMSR